MDDLPHENKAAPLQRLFDDIAITYTPVEKALDVFLEHCISYQDVEGKIVLDLGCGTGASSILFAKRGAKKVFGIDVSLGSLVAAENIKHERKVSNVHFVQCRVPPLPFRDKSIDIVFSKGTFAYISELENALEDTFRVAKDGGLLILEFVRRNTIFQLVEQIRKCISKVPREQALLLSKGLAIPILPFAKLLLGKKANLVQGKKLEQLIMEVFFSPVAINSVKSETVLMYCQRKAVYGEILPIPGSEIFSPRTSFIVKMRRR